MVLWFTHKTVELNDPCFFLGVAIILFEEIVMGNSIIGYICGNHKNIVASIESRLGCSVFISACAGGLGECKRGACAFPRGYSLTGEYQVVINLSFLGSSHTVFSCFHKHKEQLPKASVPNTCRASAGRSGCVSKCTSGMQRH